MSKVNLLMLLDHIRDINSVIMDYLIKEGYPDSAQKFAIEANIKQRPDEESIRTRVEIRNAIHSGDIKSAIERINELNTEVRTLYSIQHLLAMIINLFHAPLIAFGF
jgi:hypothetical protein